MNDRKLLQLVQTDCKTVEVVVCSIVLLRSFVKDSRTVPGSWEDTRNVRNGEPPINGRGEMFTLLSRSHWTNFSVSFTVWILNLGITDWSRSYYYTNVGFRYVIRYLCKVYLVINFVITVWNINGTNIQRSSDLSTVHRETTKDRG